MSSRPLIRCSVIFIFCSIAAHLLCSAHRLAEIPTIVSDRLIADEFIEPPLSWMDSAEPEVQPSDYKSVVEPTTNKSLPSSIKDLGLLHMDNKWTFDSVLRALPVEVSFGLVHPVISTLAADDITHAESIWSLNSICAENSFIDCDKTPGGANKVIAGMNGGGVKASLINDGTQLRIYNGCMFGTNMTEPVCNDENLIDPGRSPKVAVFVKVVKSSAETNNKILSSDKSCSALQKEIRRSRAGQHHIAGVPIGPSTYELIDTITGKWHNIHHSAIFHEYVDGKTSIELFIYLIIVANKSMIFDLKTIAQKYSDHKDFMAAESTEAAVVDRSQQILNEMVNRAKLEIFLRFRVYLSLIRSIINRSLDLWKQNIFHCDLHTNNIMHRIYYETDGEKLLHIIRNGEGFIPSFEFVVYYSLNRLPTSIVNKLNETDTNGPAGIPVILFNKSAIRFIDLGMLLMVPASKGDKVNRPCWRLRPQAQEDINELMRSMINTIFDKYFYKFPTMYSVDEYIFQMDETARKLYEDVEKSYNVMNDIRARAFAQIRDLPDIVSCGRLPKEKTPCTIEQIKRIGKSILKIMDDAANELPVNVFFE